MQVLDSINYVHEERQKIALTKLPPVGFELDHQASQRAIFAILEYEIPVFHCLKELHKFHDAGMTNLCQNLEFCDD